MDKFTLIRFVAQAAIWGSSFALIKIALTDLSPSQLVVARLVLGTIVLAIVARVGRVPLRISGRAWLHVSVSAVFANVIPYLLLAWGELHTSAGLAGVLVGGTPLITLLVATLALRESRLTRRSVVGFVVGFLGVVLVLAPWQNGDDAGLGASALGAPGPGTSGLGASGLGALACFLAAVSYAVGYVYVRRFLSPLKLEPRTLATTQLAAASVVMIAVAPAFAWRPLVGIGSGDGGIDLGVVASVLVLGCLSTGFATILYFRLIQDVGPTTAAAVDYLVPVFAVVFGAPFLAETITWNVIVGGLIVLAGMGLAEGRIGTWATATGRTSREPSCR